MHDSSIIEQADGRAGSRSRGEELREHLHGMWAAVAPAWGEHAEYADARHAESTKRMLESTAPRCGERVLELACGAGGLGLAAAELVAPDGEVVLSDVVAEMTAIAAARAAERGARNVSTCELDLERIAQPDASYDVVLCREGLMFATDPENAVRETRRVLRPGGRAAFSVWGPRARNPWLSLILETAGRQLGRPVPPAGIPGPFSLEDPDGLASLLRGAGLCDVTVEEVDAPLHASSFEEWWTRTSALAGPLAKILTAMPERAVEALLADLRAATRPYRSPAGMRFSGVTLVVSGRRGDD